MEIQSNSYCVEVNGVIVGHIPHEKMEALQHLVRTDTMVWFKQAISVCAAVLTFLRVSTSLLTGLVVVCALLLGSFEPQVVGSLLQDLLTNPDRVEGLASSFLKLWGELGAVLLCLAILTDKAFGMEDKFSAALADKMRVELDVAADGNVRWWPASSKTSPDTTSTQSN